MNCYRTFVLAALLCIPTTLFALSNEEDVKVSTHPIGSPFYRHLAFDYNIDLRELVKFEKKGFGRTEIVTLILISTHTKIPLKDYGNKRLKDKVKLRTLAEEAKMDYDALYKQARTIKEQIEEKGDSQLPPPVFEPQPTPTPIKKNKKKKAPDENKEN